MYVLLTISQIYVVLYIYIYMYPNIFEHRPIKKKGLGRNIVGCTVTIRTNPLDEIATGALMLVA